MMTRSVLSIFRNIACNVRLLLFVSVALLFIYIFKTHSVHTTHDVKNSYLNNINKDPSILNPNLNTEPEMKCVHPKLDPYHSSLRKYFHKMLPLRCDDEENWVYVFNGTFYISSNVVKKYGEVTCDVYPMVRDGDFNTNYGTVIKNVKNGTALTSDFFKVECKNSKKDKVYTNAHLGIAYRKDVHDRPKNLPSKALDMDFLMIGFDSISRMTAIRKFVKAREYFHNELQGFDLEDYNILGDGTPAALLPILTAQTEEELPEARRGHAGAKPVDGHPWIWRDFKDAGYVTLYAEDQPQVGTFHYRMLGFHDQPTDHYLRNFHITADKLVKIEYCFGSTPKHQSFLDYIRDTYTMYGSRRKFVFAFHGELSHEDSNKIDYMDEDVRNFFEYMNNHGYLNNTLLIFFSDHGARFSRNREAAQGKQEERMPMFSIRFPPWFAQKYPDVMRTVKNNAHRLTTPFDIHETLVDLLHFSGTGKGDISKRGISLFKEIPKERTCKHAAVDNHWCACLDWKPIDKSDAVLVRVIQTIQSTFNNITASHRSQCALLSIKEVKSALKFTTNDKVLAFLKAKDKDGRVGDFSAQTKDINIMYQVTLVTEPGDGHFETTVRHDLASDTFTLNKKEVSRINKYGSDPDCVASDYPYLREYCYCKKAAS